MSALQRYLQKSQTTVLEKADAMLQCNAMQQINKLGDCVYTLTFDNR